MFTGLIESVGEVVSVAPVPSGHTLRVRTTLAPELRDGESVAVNGVCLTVTHVHDGAMHADIGAETARITTLGRLRPGLPVNLERAMRADSRLGGHFVQGHVDGMSAIERVRRDGETTWIRIGVPPVLARLMVRKGSIAVDGISLTIADLTDAWFEVMIIPFTWTHTHLPSVRAGDPVNLECDMVGKYVIRAMEAWATSPAARTTTQGSATRHAENGDPARARAHTACSRPSRTRSRPLPTAG